MSATAQIRNRFGTSESQPGSRKCIPLRAPLPTSNPEVGRNQIGTTNPAGRGWGSHRHRPLCRDGRGGHPREAQRQLLPLQQVVGPAFLLVMIDTICQVALPPPSATAWVIDLREVDGPLFVVFRLTEDEARQALAHHLTEIGAFIQRAEAEQAVNGADTTSIGVIW